jgi:hypothetical protein
MPYTNRSDPKQNPWYPRHVSDRADALIEELDPAQIQQLGDALQSTTFAEWSAWLEEKRAEIGEYDELSLAGRRRRLQKPDRLYALRLHHACVFVELWHARTHASYFHFPPHGDGAQTPQAQRAMMLAVMASYSQIDPRDLWPFEFPENAERCGLFPFRDSS